MCSQSQIKYKRFQNRLGSTSRLGLLMGEPIKAYQALKTQRILKQAPTALIQRKRFESHYKSTSVQSRIKSTAPQVQRKLNSMVILMVIQRQAFEFRLKSGH